ncbi:MAG: DUF4476 domain-containing protein [Saprospiraceae bacterium]|nr:DUF4476 domain-containing protein [Saprospiraceae bacterium]
MRPARAFFVTMTVVVLTAFAAIAQSNPYGGNYRDNNNQNNSRRRPHRHCSEPYAQKAFARDYPSLANANIYHLDRSIREFTKYKCLSSEQIRRLAVLYPTDRDKYEYLSYALNYVFDIENYALTGSVLANHNARDGFYRLLVREGVPAGDYYNVYNNNVGGAYACNTCPQPQMMTPQYPQYQNQYNGQNQNQSSNQDNTYNSLPDPRYNNPQNLPAMYDEPTNGVNNGANNGLNSGYRGLMTYKEFESMKERVKQNAFDAGKLEAAKNLTQSNTLTANQVVEIVNLMTMDNNRLEFAKFAYTFTYDRENYSMVANSLSFSNNRRSLEQFISSKQ